MLSNINHITLVLASGLLAISKSALAIGPIAVNLGTAGNYAVLAQSGVSTVPFSSVTGDIGAGPIASTGLTGFSETLDRSGTFSTSQQVIGKLYAASYKPPTPSTLITAISDMQTAFNNANGRVNPNFLNLGAGNIGGLTLTPGLYKWTTGVSAAVAFTIAGNPTDTWIFQIAGNFNLATGVDTILIGGALASNIVWVVSGDVTLLPSSHLEGVVLGKTSITAQTMASVNGKLLAQTDVALQKATIVGPGLPLPVLPTAGIPGNNPLPCLI